MSDEFDDAFEIDLLHHSPKAADQAAERRRSRVARLASRLYAVSAAPLRAEMLACLLRPLGSLGLVAVASGAFASLLQRGSRPGAGLALDDLGHYSKDQIMELVHFVEQVSPEALQQLGNVIADSPMGAAAVGASLAMLLLRALHGRGPGHAEADGVLVDAPGQGQARRK
jgi:hypothetical protein